MSISKKNDALGKGIRSLLQNIDTELKTTAGNLKTDVAEKTVASQRIALDKIETNAQQPRKDFDESALKELAASIKIHNIIQPLTVAAAVNGKYRLIAGERRWRAAKLAGLKDVPVYIRENSDSDVLELALLENLQRENLNAIEIALSYKRLMDDLDYTHEHLAERMGKERSTVANYIRLLKLPPDIQIAVRKNELSMGHARALVNVDAVEKQLYIFSEIKNRSLSVRQTEDLVRNMYSRSLPVKGSGKPALTTAFKKIEDNLASAFSARVRMQHSKKGSGSILIEYNSIDELNGLLDKMNIKVT